MKKKWLNSYSKRFVSFLEFFKTIYFSFEKTLGSLKAATILIVLFAIAMIIGTFVESLAGVEMAAALVYKAGYFFTLQFFLFLSILFATFQRFPLKKRLAGFYVIHLGILLIGCGSVITYIAGIDGSIFLAPKEQTRRIILNNNQIKISIPEDGKNAYKTLPRCAFSCSLNFEYNHIKFETFLPFADQEMKWTNDYQENGQKTHSSAQYRIYNGMADQKFTMSLDSYDSAFGTKNRLGPLTIFYLPSNMSTCFKKSKSGYFFWNSITKTCFTPESKNIVIHKSPKNSKFMAIKVKDQVLAFFPDLSPWPYDKSLKIDRTADLRVFSLTMLEKNPILFLFGKKAAFFNKEESKWFIKDLSKKEIELPWMGFILKLIHYDDKKIPILVPKYVFPKKVKNRFVHGGTKAIRINIDGKRFWITDERSGIFNVNGKKIKISIGPENLFLPFQFSLDKFVMKTAPGTQMPASYESFVTVLDSKGPSSHHIYMNNPFKKKGFTFYQASYSRNSDNSYSSTLSANFDPGRSIKYFGSLLLVLGAIWHFGFAKRRKKTKIKNKQKDG